VSVESLEQRLAELTPREAIALLERSMGPLVGAHYVLQRGSELELADGGWLELEGEFSLIDCRDPEQAIREPEREFSYWIGGLRLSAAPDILIPLRTGSTQLPILGGPGISERLGWGPLYIKETRVTRFERKLDLWIAEEGQSWARVSRRRLQLAPESMSLARFASEDSACPEELTLHLRLEESSTEWERLEGEEGPEIQRIGGSYTSESLAWLTLELLRVSYEAEIFDLEQRAPRLAASSGAGSVRTQPRGPSYQPLRVREAERSSPIHIQRQGTLDLR
jgi:hypothetical protein